MCFLGFLVAWGIALCIRHSMEALASELAHFFLLNAYEPPSPPGIIQICWDYHPMLAGNPGSCRLINMEDIRWGENVSYNRTKLNISLSFVSFINMGFTKEIWAGIIFSIL